MIVRVYLKPYLILILLLAVSCIRARENEAPEAGAKTVLFHAAPIPTKTHFGEPSEGVYPCLWSSEGDKVALSLNYSEAVEAAVTVSSDGRTADFEAKLPASGSPYVFRAFSPSSAVKAVSPSRKAWSITIPSVQTPLPGSPDQAAQLLAAESESYPVLPDEVSLRFSHVSAYGRLSFANLELGDAAVRKIELTASVPLCGDWYFDGESLSPSGSSSTLTIITSSTNDIWFASAPAALGGGTLSITIFTDKGNMFKEVRVPDTYSLLAGRVAKISVDMAGTSFQGEEAFYLVKDASTLAAGDEVILVHEGSSVAIAAQKDTYREKVDVSISDHSITSLPDAAAVFTLEEGSSSGTWAFKSADGYLAAASSNYNQLVSISSRNLNSSWSISISEEGEAIVKADNSSYSRNWLLYNVSSSRFCCYASTSTQAKKIQIYRRGASGEATAEDPITALSQYGLYLGEKERVYMPGRDQYSREYGESLTFTILDPESGEQLEISGYRPSLRKGDRLSVKVVWRKGVTSIMNSTYDMAVVREEASKVWLADGTGRGFIIRK